MLKSWLAVLWLLPVLQDPNNVLLVADGEGLYHSKLGERRRTRIITN